MSEINELVGLVLVEVKGEKHDDEIFIRAACGRSFKMFHNQDCCESVQVEDICGDLDDLIGSPILLAEEVTNSDDPPPGEGADESWTWTFYKLATMKGAVTIRWFGTSNGYYSESVNFVELDTAETPTP